MMTVYSSTMHASSDDQPAGPAKDSRALRILYIHPIGVFGGSSRSLLELISSLPADVVEPRVLTAAGNFAPMLCARGIEVITASGFSRFDNTLFSAYRGWRWLLLLRELYLLPGTLMAVWRAYRAWPDIDLIHVNEITAIPSWLLARRLFRKPVVMHVRSVLTASPASRRVRWIGRLLQSQCEQVIAIDETVRASLQDPARAMVVHNVFSTARAASDPQVEAMLNRISATALRVGFVGNFLEMKGILDLVEAVGLCVARGLDIQLIMVGGNTRHMTRSTAWLLRKARFARDVESGVSARVDALGISARVHTIGFTEAIGSVYRNIDVLCFPSHLDAVGRPVIEAAFYGKPSIVAITNPKPDTFVDGVTGLAVPAADVPALASAIERLARAPEQVQAMGRAALDLAQRNFDPEINARRVLDVYRRLQPR